MGVDRLPSGSYRSRLTLRELFADAQGTRAKGYFTNEQAALTYLYLVVRSLDPTGRGRRRWMNRWKPALDAFAITFEGRLPPAGE